MKELQIEIEKILDEYSDSARQIIEETAGKVAKKGADKLKQTSPKDKGRYAKGWGVEDQSQGLNKTAKIIRNKKHYSLTHLLEFGHATRNGGRTRAQPHIGPVEKEVMKGCEEELRRKLERGTI